MDKRTEHILKQVGANMPRHIRENLMRDKVKNEGQEERAKELLKSRHLSDKEKHRVADLIRRGAFKPEKEAEVNPEMARKADEYNTQEVQRLIKTGVLPPPKEDDFTRKMKKLSDEKNRRQN